MRVRTRVTIDVAKVLFGIAAALLALDTCGLHRDSRLRGGAETPIASVARFTREDPQAENTDMRKRISNPNTSPLFEHGRGANETEM